MWEGFYAEYLVQFGELSRNVKSYFKDNLEDVIRRQFHIDPEQPLMVQYFDREWNMWTNCNWDNITPGSKLKVSYVDGGQGMDMYQTQPDDNSMFLMPDSEFTTVLPNFVQRRWPDVYRLPMEKIEMDILMVLDQGFCPQERRLTRFLDAIYEDATRYTFYPQGIHYEEMANAILDKWPHLVTEKPGMTMAEAKVLWKRRLCQKFQNSRKRRDKNIAEVQLKRKNKNFR